MMILRFFRGVGWGEDRVLVSGEVLTELRSDRGDCAESSCALSRLMMRAPRARDCSQPP